VLDHGKLDVLVACGAINTTKIRENPEYEYAYDGIDKKDDRIRPVSVGSTVGADAPD